MYMVTHIRNVSVAILCSSFVITMSMWPSQININQKDVALPAHATQDEILNAFHLLDFPLEAYPKQELKVKWNIPQPGADDIAVDLQRQALIV